MEFMAVERGLSGLDDLAEAAADQGGRWLARVYARRGELGRFVVASPVMLGFLIAWALGEAIGTLTGRP